MQDTHKNRSHKLLFQRYSFAEQGESTKYIDIDNIKNMDFDEYCIDKISESELDPKSNPVLLPSE